ncbi:hypothetical protein Tco_0849493, partial [Tanacetum coccineum]
IMSSATSAVTYTSVYTDSKPGKAFWGADDEEDEHEFLAEEQPIRPVDSPTAKSPGYVTKSDPEEDPEEYKDDKTEDGLVDYPMNGGDNGDDDDSDSSGDDADKDEDDEDEDDKEEEEEEHIALADSTIAAPVDEPVFPPEGTEPVIPPPSTDITIGARITVWPQTSISLPPEAEVERLLTMTTPLPSPPISLSPPSAGECLARCITPPAHSSPLLPSSGCPTQIQTLRIASTQALIDAVTAALPSPSLPPLPLSLYIPPLVDRRDDIPEFEQPPRKRLYLSTLGFRYEIEESSTARPTRGRRIDYGFFSTVDAEERQQGIRDVRVTELAELHEHDTRDLYALLEDAQDTASGDSADSRGVRPMHPKRLGSFGRLSQAVHFELQTHRKAGADVQAVRIMSPVTRLGPIPPPNTQPNNMTPESVQAMIEQALLRNSTNGDGSHSSHGDNRRNVQTIRPCFYADFQEIKTFELKGNGMALVMD